MSKSHRGKYLVAHSKEACGTPVEKHCIRATMDIKANVSVVKRVSSLTSPVDEAVTPICHDFESSIHHNVLLILF